METNAEFEAVKDIIMAIPEEKVLRPNMPVTTFLQEAKNLYMFAEDDVKKLAVCGVSKATLNELYFRIEACRIAENNWEEVQTQKREDAQIWNERAIIAFDFRDGLIHSCYYAFRKDDELIRQIQSFDSGTSNVNMIQDLTNLILLCRQHLDKLVPLNITEKSLNKILEMTEEMSKLLDSTNGEQSKPHEFKEIRDQAYTYLKELVDDIRAAGKFVFWKDIERLPHYTSKYIWKKHRKTAKHKVAHL